MRTIKYNINSKQRSLHNKITEKDKNEEKWKINEALDPNINDIVEFAMVGGMDESYVNPKNFKEAWNHSDEYGR